MNAVISIITTVLIYAVIALLIYWAFRQGRVDSREITATGERREMLENVNRDAGVKTINRMTNWQRTRWAKAGYSEAAIDECANTPWRPHNETRPDDLLPRPERDNGHRGCSVRHEDRCGLSAVGGVLMEMRDE